jgi:ribose transport system permease protein
MNSQVSKFVSAKAFVIKYSPFFILLILTVISTVLSPVFFTWGNICNVLRQQAPIALIAIGGLLVIVSGGIDLSVGAVLALCHVLLAFFITKCGMSSPLGVFIAIVLAVIAGILAGSLNGLLISYLKMAPFIATLAVMTMARGAAFMLTGGSPIRLPVDRMTAIGSAALVDFGQYGDPLIGLPRAVWLVIVVTAIFWFIMKYTSLGRLLIASGSNETALRLSGVNANRYKFTAYVISGALAALGAVLLSARAGISTPAAGVGNELTAIAACVIGGASLSGGKGKITNTIVGVLIMALIGNIMNLLSIAAYPQQVIQGAIIILAVVLNSLDTKQ